MGGSEISPLFSLPSEGKSHGLTYNCRWGCRQHTVEDKRGNEAFILGSGVRFHQLPVLAKEALDMHLESVCALKVVGEQNGPGHDDELEIQHGDRGVRRRLFSSRASEPLCDTHPPSPPSPPPPSQQCNANMSERVSAECVSPVYNICYIKLWVTPSPPPASDQTRSSARLAKGMRAAVPTLSTGTRLSPAAWINANGMGSQQQQQAKLHQLKKRHWTFKKNSHVRTTDGQAPGAN